ERLSDPVHARPLPTWSAGSYTPPAAPPPAPARAAGPGGLPGPALPADPPLAIPTHLPGVIGPLAGVVLRPAGGSRPRAWQLCPPGAAGRGPRLGHPGRARRGHGPFGPTTPSSGCRR